MPDGVEIRSIGEQRLKDIDRPEPLHELTISGLAQPTAVTADASQPPGPADLLAGLPAWVQSVAGPLVPTADRAREAIESRVMAEIQRALDEDTDPGSRRSAKASVVDEIARLQELRERGALTDEQYARAVDRVVGQEAG